MLRPAPITQFFSFPITTAIAVGAIIVYIQTWMMGQTIDMMVMDGRVWDQWQLWRALTSVFPHAHVPLHLLFNLYWFWTFGTLLEREYGHFKYLGIILVLSYIAPLAEFMFLYGGIGLSGVVYGLWGMLWVLQRNDRRFIGAVDDRTSQTMIVWFFVCIVLTKLGIMPVANIEHGVGAITGGLLGYLAGGRTPARIKSALGLVALTALVTLGSTILWPYCNRTSYAEAVVEGVALDRLEHKDNQAAVKYMEKAVKMQHAGASTWYNLGVAYQDSGQMEKAVVAYIYAGHLPDADEDMKKLAWGLEHPQVEVQTNATH